MYIVFVVLTTTTTTPPPPPRFDLEGRCRTLFKEGSFGNGSEDTGHVKCRCLEKGFRQQAVCKVKMELWRGVVGQGAQVPDHSRNEIIREEREEERERKRYKLSISQLPLESSVFSVASHVVENVLREDGSPPLNFFA